MLSDVVIRRSVLLKIVAIAVSIGIIAVQLWFSKGLGINDLPNWSFWILVCGMLIWLACDLYRDRLVYGLETTSNVDMALLGAMYIFVMSQALAFGLLSVRGALVMSEIFFWVFVVFMTATMTVRMTMNVIVGKTWHNRYLSALQQATIILIVVFGVIIPNWILLAIVWVATVMVFFSLRKFFWGAYLK